MQTGCLVERWVRITVLHIPNPLSASTTGCQSNGGEICPFWLAQARRELKEARGRVEALLQEKAGLQGRLAALQETAESSGTKVRRWSPDCCGFGFLRLAFPEPWCSPARRCTAPSDALQNPNGHRVYRLTMDCAFAFCPCSPAAEGERDSDESMLRCVFVLQNMQLSPHVNAAAERAQPQAPEH